jgi:glycogen debranching enzyme
MVEANFKLSILMASDNADTFLVRGYLNENIKRGALLRPLVLVDGKKRERGLVFTYQRVNGAYVQTLVSFSGLTADLIDSSQNGPDWYAHIVFALALKPGESRTLELRIAPLEPSDQKIEVLPAEVEEKVLKRNYAKAKALADDRFESWWLSWCQVFTSDEAVAEQFGRDLLRSQSRRNRKVVLENSTIQPLFDRQGEKGGGVFQEMLERAKRDLYILLCDDFVQAGIPWYMSFFGRDSLILAMQILPFFPELSCKILRAVARLQSHETDQWRNARPGATHHELVEGELADMKWVPHTPYYGSLDSTPLFLKLFVHCADWTADRRMTDELWENVIAAVRYCLWEFERGGGWMKYGFDPSQVLSNPIWCDSHDSQRLADGSLATPPIATVEVQAYAFEAFQGLARIASILGKPEATMLNDQALDIQRRFQNDFWMPEKNMLARGLHAAGLIDSVSSNLGHCLGLGLLDPEKERLVADRLMRADMLSLYGIRTLSSKNPGFNPGGYHTGTVWSWDNAWIGASLCRMQRKAAAHKIGLKLVRIGASQPLLRQPELVCSDELPEVVRYFAACSPQAWSTGCLFHLLAGWLGLRADALNHALYIDSPSLPEWLPRVRTFGGMRVGSSLIELVFDRHEDGSTSVQAECRDGLTTVFVNGKAVR